MKKIIVAVIVLICFLGPAEAQELDHKIYLPLVRIGSDGMSEWLVIVPAETENLITEPSFEDGITAWTAAGAVITRQTTQSFWGVASLRLVTANAAANEGAYFSHNPGAAGTFTGSIWVYGTGGTVRVRVRDQTNATETVGAPVTLGAWQRIEVTHTAGAACADLRLYVETNIQQNITYFADGAQLEEQAEATTYCDGDQEGCEWLGAEHGSTSQRSAQSRAGGLIRDLQDNYRFEIGQFISTGMPPLNLSVDSYAILPGGELNSIKVVSRVFTLTGVIRGTSIANLHANKQALLNVLKPGAVPGDQPVRIRYTGAAVIKQIAAHYESGLETSIIAEMECWERVAIRFLADDPFWYGIGDDSEELDSEDGATLRYITARLRSTGQWDDLGLTADPAAAGIIYAIVVAPDRRIYVGGSFTNLNNAGTGMDNLAVYDPQTDAWTPVGPANSVNDAVRALEFGPDGILYIGGDFLNLGGGNGDKFSSYDPSTNTFNDVVAGPAAGLVYTLTFGLDGILYLGGSFVDWGDADGDYITSWDGAALSSLGIGMGSFVYGLGTGIDGIIYAGGAFLTAGAVGANRIAQWDGTAWSALGSGFEASARTIATGIDGTIYVGGFFATAGGITVNYIAGWNGVSWFALGSGFDISCYCLAVGSDGIVYAGGLFTEAGGIVLADRVAKWNGSSWAHLDVNLPGAPTTHAIATGIPDPVVEQNYDVYLGFSTTGAGVFAGDITITNDGTESAYPKITISRSGGTSAILEEIRNETTGKELLFDYSLLDGETLTIDLSPTAKSIISSFFGARPSAILPNSDFGTFALRPGNNLVTCFVATDATVESFLIWESTFWSND